MERKMSHWSSTRAGPSRRSVRSQRAGRWSSSREVVSSRRLVRRVRKGLRLRRFVGWEAENELMAVVGWCEE